MSDVVNNSTGLPTAVPAGISGLAAVAGSLLPSVTAIYGPYEMMFIEGLKVLEMVIKDMPADVKAEYWKEWLLFHKGVQGLVDRVDFLHLFHPKA